MKKILSAVGLVAAAVGGYLFLTGGEEKVIRNRIRDLATALSAPANEPPLARVGRLGPLRNYFTPDVAVELPGEGLSLRGQDELLGLAGRAPVPSSGIVVETGDIEVQIQSDRQTADARFPARILERGPDAAESILDARTVALTLVRRDRTWRISSARIMPSDDAAIRWP